MIKLATVFSIITVLYYNKKCYCPNQCFRRHRHQSEEIYTHKDVIQGWDEFCFTQKSKLPYGKHNSNLKRGPASYHSDLQSQQCSHCMDPLRSFQRSTASDPYGRCV